MFARMIRKHTNDGLTVSLSGFPAVENLFEKYGIQEDDNEAKIKAKIHLNFKLKLLSLGII